MAEYAERDPRQLGEHYTRHVSAMTAEGLHAKSDIAAELAWRDAEIARLTMLRDEAERLLAEWNVEASALLDRVWSECDVSVTEFDTWTGQPQGLLLSGPPELLRELAEALGKG